MATSQPMGSIFSTSLSPCFVRLSDMGWIGFGAFVVSATYILYKHPPYSWDFGPWRCAQQPGAAALAPKPSGARKTPEHSFLQDELDLDSVAQDSRGAEIESTETTPKVSAIATPLSLNVPTLNLDETSTSSVPDAQPASLQPPKVLSPPLLNTPTIETRPQALPPPAKPSGLMPPPPRPSARVPLRPPPSAASSLRAPPSRTPAGSKLSSSTLSPLGLAGKPQKSSRQVTLEPGHSPLDWAALTSDPRNNLRGKDLPPSLIRVTPSMLKLHNGRKGYDAWTSYQGKVYNITPYLPFHPGGKGELLRGAGKDSGRLFLEVHPWVNWDGMLSECVVGILVSEHDPEDRTGALDEMD
ncbi:potential heme/steroid binding protein [Uncinocarpus reesii 1704]|uniref:Potential heme/steroid binding protein n=1 Tax=Uncinocarpus reesii (strain UAMH 1704) TaxID=336963 RepID=C4JFM2_UNCRE|nr:putative heme/steroid binding protein [Uncinocarpus reesii 1704]EEP77507.1 potential heme/steroid binding protein [Uncinocarpus reesii 1704]